MAALQFEEVDLSPHFEKESFRVKKKIFATLNPVKKLATVKLNQIDQSVFCAIDSAVLFPVPGAWGKQGWTHINLKTVKNALLLDILTSAYCTVAPPKLALKYRSSE
ncbi:MAG: hypothetical protein A1D16_17005 [Flavihumibacter sp. CACIAM 22H1]|nr:MAG: hypothetical protein A1D16_17005 [Flavihumibacter sp. CACIAM 22H1]